MNGKDRKEPQHRYSSYITVVDGMAEVVIVGPEPLTGRMLSDCNDSKSGGYGVFVNCGCKGTALFQTVSGQNPTANALSAVGRT